jgi:hypothetical protein
MGEDSWPNTKENHRIPRKLGGQRENKKWIFKHTLVLLFTFALQVPNRPVLSSIKHGCIFYELSIKLKHVT